MKRFFTFFFLICALHLHAFELEEPHAKEPDPFGEPYNSLDILSGEPSALVHQCVNVITGDYIDIATDLKLPGAEPLTLARFYSSSDTRCQEPLRAWKFNHDKVAYQPLRHSKSDLILRDSFGAMIPFKRHQTKDKISDYQVHPEIFHKRITNTAKKMSGMTHLKNKTLKIFDNHETLISQDGTGSKFYFKNPSSKKQGPLEKVEKINGNQIEYSYDKLQYLERIVAKNKKGITFSELKFKMKPSSKLGNFHLEITGTGDALAEYDICAASSNSSKKWIIEKAKPFESPEEMYSYDANFERIVSKELPDDHLLKIDYYKTGHNAVWPNKDYFVKGIRTGRVMQLSAPAGPNNEVIPIYRFLYFLDAHKEKGGPLDIRSGRTEVYDAYDHKTAYHFNSEERLSKIEHFKERRPNHQLYSQELFFWGAPDSPDAGNLMTKALTLPDGTGVYCKSFEYDRQGNVEFEYLYGNLTGTRKTSWTIDDQGKPSKGCECLKIRHKYTNDARNLISYENNAAYPHDCRYDYEEGTDRLKAKFIIDKQEIRQRLFYQYDDNGAVTLEIVDDGSSLDSKNLDNVTERRIKRITNTTSFPLGLPEVIEEKFLDPKTGQEHLLKKTVNAYDDKGKLKSQTIFDSQGTEAYTLTWKYNELGLVVEETNALGQTLIRDYDENGNKILEQGFNKSVHHKYRYNKMNHMTSDEEVWTDGTTLTQIYVYDNLGNCIASTNIHNQTTQIAYDEFNRPVKKTSPNVLDENGNKANASYEKNYDALGNVISMTDSHGAATTARYTIRGKPFYIGYPDGSEEHFEYTIKGQLKKAVARNGTYTVYKYDYMARPILEQIFSPTGVLLKETKRTYNAFHLIEERDPEGCITTYDYDGAGRLIRTVKGESRTDYTYDNLSRIKEKREFYGQGEIDYIATRYAYDFLDRMKEESVRDSSGKIYRSWSYNYDDEGRRTEVGAETHAGTAISQTHYNPHGDTVERIDPLGHTTLIQNHYVDGNITEETDPLGRTTITTKDALGRVLKTEVKNPFGRIIKKVEYTYDTVGNRRACIETVLMPNAQARTVVTEWEYNTSGQMIQQTEACRTPEQKTTTYTYYPTGKLKTKTKPDGTVVRYEYDALERLSLQESSDGTVHYKYHYDRNDNLICVEDLITGLRTIKDYDGCNRLMKETLANGIVIGYDYDRMGRLTEVRLPDQSLIKYQYEGPDLSKVLRMGSNGKQLYAHTYEKYDLAGNLLQSKLIGKTGKSDYTYDLCSRPLSHTATGIKEIIKEYDPTGNLKESELQDAIGTIGSRHVYDDLDQLLSSEGTIPQVNSYDSLANPVKINELPCLVDDLNQLRSKGQTIFEYDLNGNRICKNSQAGDVIYAYDARDRLVSVTQQKQKYSYAYDPSNRRISKCIYHWNGADWQLEQTIKYLYQGSKEIGAVDEQGRLIELRVLGKSALGDEIAAAVALELQGEVFSPISDSRGNIISIISAKDKSPFETYRYSPFGEEQIFDANGSVRDESLNPWRYASKRKDSESGLIYFGQRFYDPETCRWLTADPAGFIDGMNLYAFNHNNPLKYIDKDGRFAWLIPIAVYFGVETTVVTTTFYAVAGTVVGGLLGIGVYEGCKYLDHRINDAYIMNALVEDSLEECKEKKGRKRGKDNEIKDGPPREQDTGNYLPDPAAEGNRHTTLGEKNGRKGPYTQGATFDEYGKFKGRTDVTDHGRGDHPNPHYHPATGKNSANSDPQPITFDF